MVRIGLLLLLLLPTACATTAPSSGPVARVLPTDFDAGPPINDVVRKPQSPAEAGLMIAEALDLLGKKKNEAALLRFSQLLRCDFLTERGRANLYWLTAEAARDVDEVQRRDALGGYLVAASVLPPDAEVRDKMGRARAMLLADKVQAGGLGDRPERAIVVESVGEADSLVAQLGCGARGRSPYVERHVLVTARGDEDGLAARRLLCTENGDELVLWFRVQR